MKIQQDDELAFARTVSAKSSLINQNGFSPAQLVFGLNSNLPNNMTTVLPALEAAIKSYDLASHISALHTSRKAFASEKLKMALKKNTQNYQRF